MLVNGYEVAFMYARLDGALVSLDVQVYAIVEVADVGERDG
jgi:hypothetical protein